MSEWVSVADRLPAHQDRVLITDGKVVTAAEHFRWAYPDMAPWKADLVDGYEWEWEFDRRAVTHWMEMPSPPQSEGQS